MRILLRERRNRRRWTPEEVYEMRCASLVGVSHTAIAAAHGVAQSTATRAINGTTYADVPHPVEVPRDEGPALGKRAFLSYRGAVEALASASPEEVEVRVDERPSPKGRACHTLKLLDMIEGLGGTSMFPGLEADSRARAAKLSRDRREYLRKLLTDALGDE
jgi:transposase-like protein